MKILLVLKNNISSLDLIDINDDAQIAIEPDDNPYIPKDMDETAPIIRVLEGMREIIK